MFIDKKDLPVIALQFFQEQGLEIKGKDDKTGIMFATVGEFVWQDESLSKNEIRILLFLNNCCRDKCYTWIAQDTIAKEINISLKQVNRVIKKLEEKKYIRTKMVKQSNNMYNNITVLTYSPYLKKQYKSSLDKTKPASKCPSSRAKNVQAAGLKMSQEDDSLRGKNNSRSTTILFNNAEGTTSNAGNIELDEYKTRFLQNFKHFYPEVKIRRADLLELKDSCITEYTNDNLPFWRWFVLTTDDDYIRNNGSLDLLLLLRNQTKFKKHLEVMRYQDDDIERYFHVNMHVGQKYLEDWIINEEISEYGRGEYYKKLGVKWSVYTHTKWGLKEILPSRGDVVDYNFNKIHKAIDRNSPEEILDWENSNLNPKNEALQYINYYARNQYHHIDYSDIQKIEEIIKESEIYDMAYIKEWIGEINNTKMQKFMEASR